MQSRIITISRQYGSGGRQIGERLAKRLGIPFYEKEIIDLAAKQSGIVEDFFVLPEQREYLLRDFSVGASMEPSLGDKVYLAQAAVLRALAEKGPCVIVGRGAGGVLNGAVPLLNVFLYADLETRKQRAVEEYGDSAHKIEERIAAIDKKRAAYFKFYTGVNGGQMEHYDLCIDSGFTGIENAVTLLETAYLFDAKRCMACK